MTLPAVPWRDWPALAGLGRARRWRLHCEQGCWVPGGEDGHWQGASAGFDAAVRARAAGLLAGGLQDPAPAGMPGLLWSVGPLCLAAAQAGQAWRVLAWPRQDLPAALAALGLTSRVLELAAEAGPGPAGALPAVDNHLDETAIEELIAEGRRAAAAGIDLVALAEAYGAVLAGAPVGAPVIGVRGSAGPPALAALLLPLPRTQADHLSLAAGVRNPAADGPWLQLSPAAAALPMLTPELRASGLALAQRLLGEAAGSPPLGSSPRDPGPTPPASATAPPPVAAAPAAPLVVAPPAPAGGQRILRLWGAASSGKTAFLAQLFTRYRHGGDPAWSVRLPPGSHQAWFEARLAGFEQHNRFPEPTPVGANDQLQYLLVNEVAGRQALIALEDRPGRDYETFDPETARRLAGADALLLMLDPLRDPATQTEEISRGLLAVQQARGTADPDPRPLALCVSKCDALIHTVEDLARAQQEPEAFLGRWIGRTILEAVGHYFRRHRLFALSAAGLRISHGAVLPAVFYDEALELRISRAGVPLNLLAPLVWLLEELET